MSIGSDSPSGFVGDAHGYERHGNPVLIGDNAQQAFLLQLTDALRPLSDAGEIQMTASRMLCEHLGASRTLYAEIEGEPDAQVCVIRGQFVREGQPLPERMPYSRFVGGFAAETLRRGQPVVLTDANADPRFKADVRNAWVGAGVAAAIIISLVKQGREEVNFGVDNLRPREWTQAEVELVQEVAERTWAVARRARAETALRESEEKYRSLFAEMVQGYAECELVRDAQGHAVDFRFVELNPAFERLVGIPVSCAIGRVGHEVLPGTETWWPRTFERIIKTGHAERIEHEVTSSGHWYEVYVYPHKHDRFTVFFENITERKRAEIALQDAARAKDEFLAMLGHELRNPLSPIATTLQLMKMRAPGTLTAEREIIEKQVHYLTDMVDDLLDVARIARGKVELKAVAIDVSEIAAAAIETVRPLMEEREHTLHVEVESDLIIQADFRRLVQVVVNLLTNAAKYSPQGRAIYLTTAAEGNEAVLRVRDEGVGIEPDMLPRVFDLFSQERQSLDRSRGGLGLGLAIVRNLVTLHGGNVSASSQGRDRGSEFVVRLPRLKGHAVHPFGTGQPSAMAAEVTEQVRSQPARVLVVDDYALAGESLAMLLQEFGFETQVAHDGATALAAMEQFNPDIALIDIGLPVMDGYEVARAIRSMPQFEKLPLIAVTGYGQDSDRARVKEAGFDEHLVKPINAERIGQVVETMLAR